MSAASPPGGGPSVVRCKVRRWQGSDPAATAIDRVAAEEPLEIRVETRSMAVVMRTPGHDEELAAGFLLTEGLLGAAGDLKAMRRNPRNRDGNVLDVFLEDGRNVDFERFTRHVFVSSSCGLCGRASIAAVRRQFPPTREHFLVSAGILERLPARLREAQSGFDVTGGLHAAAVFTEEGELRLLREDVGRHNAVDKVLGRLLLDGQLPVRRGLLLVSGRASFEIVQKAMAGGVGMVAAVGAPSSLAVAFSRSMGQTLVGFLREGRFNVYAGAERIRELGVAKRGRVRSR